MSGGPGDGESHRGHELEGPILLVAEDSKAALALWGADSVLSVHMGMSYSYYILLYTAIYDFCTQNRPSMGSFGGAARGGANLQGADLYRSLHSYLSDHCREMREVGHGTISVPGCQDS